MKIEKRIKSNYLLNKKNIRLDMFLNEILYSIDGYYNNNKPIGSKKDFVTAPEISQMFGEIIGLYLLYYWKTKINSKFNLIELGPGNGTLFKDIVRSVSNYPDFLNKAKIVFIEINKELKKIQKQNFKELKINNIYWDNRINFRTNNPYIIYSNEFFDCFPVRQFIYKNSWHEKYIRYEKKEDNFKFIEKLVKNKKLLSFLEKYKKNQILEVSFERNNYFEKICKIIKKKGGLFFTIDYGYFKNIRNFTLQAVQNHKYSNILEDVGNKDVSSHVNFGDFFKIAKKYNLRIEEFCSQRDFLIKFGIKERHNNIRSNSKIKNIDVELSRLIDKNKMGELFKCIVVSNL